MSGALRKLLGSVVCFLHGHDEKVRFQKTRGFAQFNLPANEVRYASCGRCGKYLWHDSRDFMEEDPS